MEMDFVWVTLKYYPSVDGCMTWGCTFSSDFPLHKLVVCQREKKKNKAKSYNLRVGMD